MINILSLGFQSQWLVAFILNTILICFAQRLPLLTSKGWFHAGVLGTILWGCLGWKGWFAVVIYLFVGSIVTRLGIAKKKISGLAEARGGRRGPENVWGSAATGTFLAVLFGAGIGEQSLLFVGFAASFTAKLADTFGSEIGKIWGRKAFLITTFKPVPAGTEGAVSIIGTLASLLGSIFMSAVMFYLDFIDTFEMFLMVIVVGFIATLVESLIGALFQEKVDFLSNEFVNFLQTSLASILAIGLTSINL